MQYFSSKSVLNNHEQVRLSINGAQPVKLEKGTIEFKNVFKQILIPFKIFCDLECILKSVESYEVLALKNVKITFLVVLLTNLFVLMIYLVNQLLFTEVKIMLINFLKQFLKSMNTAKN